jgi:hypothetical protein
MQNGQAQAFGPKEEVLRKVLRYPPPAVPTPLKVVPDNQGQTS